MKNWILVIGIATITYSCGSKSTDSLTELKQQKDSLKSLYDDIAAQIAVIDQQINAADTTARLPLVTLNTIEVKPFSHFVEIQGAVETGGNHCFIQKRQEPLQQFWLKKVLWLTKVM